ncbi:hypothetical protein P3W85_24275 [Cupriavidus basilensis]|uniref:Membrane-anchored protein n=1 Tax=Cupriavidus basilensis TaxID=68895 RepID=A0ABT6ATT9_9BURK|nr:hypothetical protein [Cupriavidus basilensis]MDF3836044.1 hypothetical protein [Cupriavidus basilensis]
MSQPASLTLFPPAGRNKVPEVTAFFWIIKMMSTTVGETAADYLNVNLGLGLASTSAVTGLLLAVALFFQMRAKRYVPSLYWTSVLLISVFGTLITDNLSDRLGVPLSVSTTAFSLALIATFAVWHAREGTLSIRAIDTVRRECFYWAAILFTFALGTAAGDWVAEGLGLGYGYSALLFGGLIGAIALARYAFRADTVACFWLAYVLTRPFGASCGDLMSQSVQDGGLGLGTAGTSAMFLATIVGLVIYLSLAQKRLVNS